MTAEDKIKYRKEYNLNIIRCLQEIAEKYDNLRFIQLLDCLGLPTVDTKGNDRYHEESYDTYKKIIRSPIIQ